VRLPEGTDEDKVKAGYKDGILTVRIPFDRPSREAKKIAVSPAE
jgi:HSP20 family molecular chaperone IbpA